MLGIRFAKVINANIEYLQPVYKQLYNFDMKHFIKNLKGVMQFEDDLNWRLCGCSSLEEYQHKYATGTYMERIKVPTMIYYTEDDPIIQKNCIEFEKGLKNENILICSTNYGAHLCNYEHFFKIDQWIHKPAFEFFDYFKKSHIS